MEYHVVVVSSFGELCKVFACLWDSPGELGSVPSAEYSEWFEPTMLVQTYLGGVIPVELELDVAQARL